MTTEQMIAFDTCLLVRFLADDDKAQADLAEELMRTHMVFNEGFCAVRNNNGFCVVVIKNPVKN